MYTLSKQFSDEFNKLNTKSMNDNKIDNDEYNEFVKLYEDYKKNRKNKLSIFFRLKILVLSNNNVFSNNNNSINIYPRSGYYDR